MGRDHYPLHGRAFRVSDPVDLEQLDDVQALGGNVKLDPDLDAWIGH